MGTTNATDPPAAADRDNPLLPAYLRAVADAAQLRSALTVIAGLVRRHTTSDPCCETGEALCATLHTAVTAVVASTLVEPPVGDLDKAIEWVRSLGFEAGQ